MQSGGTEAQHIGESTGGECFLYNHYVTTNQYTYGSHWNGFEPTLKTYQRGGYVSNNRPVIQYNTSLDKIDNPGMIEVLKTNYLTETHHKFRNYDRKYGNESFPGSVYYPRELFTLGKSTSLPSTKTLACMYATENFKLSELPIQEYHRPLLWKISNKDSLSAENDYNGPGMWSTQYTTTYVPKKQATAALDPSRMGVKEKSGFTLNNKTVETILSRPDSCYANTTAGWLTNRPTGKTQYQKDYLPFNRKEVNLNDIGSLHVMQDGFTIGNRVNVEFMPTENDKAFTKAEDLPYGKLDKLKKENRPEYWNSYHNQRYPSYYKSEFQNPSKDEIKTIPDASEKELRKREETGITRNNKPVLEGLASAPDRFITNNMMDYSWTAPRDGSDREGYVNMNTLPICHDGFTISTGLNSFEEQIDSLKRLPELRNYQGRSIIRREEMTTAPTKIRVL